MYLCDGLCCVCVVYGCAYVLSCVHVVVLMCRLIVCDVFVGVIVTCVV